MAQFLQNSIFMKQLVFICYEYLFVCIFQYRKNTKILLNSKYPFGTFQNNTSFSDKLTIFFSYHDWLK